MRATELLQKQIDSINAIFHDVADDLTPDELTTRLLPHTNLIAFDLWHVGRTRDWAVQTLAQGVPELIEEPRWQGRGMLATLGIGVGMTEAQADELARSLRLADILTYADAMHERFASWLAGVSDDALDETPDIPARISRYPVYLTEAMREEVPWLYERPPVWRCLSPAIAHCRDHLIEIDFLKKQMRSGAH